jgi:hypothetical protein
MRKAGWLLEVLDSVAPVASIYFAIPSLRTLIRGVRGTAATGGGPFAHELSGVAESSLALAAFGRRARKAFGALVPAGQVLERTVESQLFGACGPWPDLPFHSKQEED